MCAFNIFTVIAKDNLDIPHVSQSHFGKVVSAKSKVAELYLCEIHLQIQRLLLISKKLNF